MQLYVIQLYIQISFIFDQQIYIHLLDKLLKIFLQYTRHVTYLFFVNLERNINYINLFGKKGEKGSNRFKI